MQTVFRTIMVYFVNYTVSDICGGDHVADEIPKSFSSLLYPLKYPNNAYCEWNIRTTSTDQQILFNFFEFNLGNDDFFDIYQVSIINDNKE